MAADEMANDGTNGLLERHREQILRICAEHGALNVRVFGSFARGEARPDSDVDFLIDVASEHSGWFPGGLLMDLQDLPGAESGYRHQRCFALVYSRPDIARRCSLMTRDKIYIVHILECITRIEEYTQAGKHDFETFSRTQDAVIRNLHVLSESTQRISQPIRERYPGVYWRGISAFRNVIAHDYLGIDLNQIWDIVEENLPVLKGQMEEILQSLEHAE
jgi:uncharacterized protein with HEPN domain/predicted nucleotidyltransferase